MNSPKSPKRTRARTLLLSASITVVAALSGCAAFDPQGSARAYAPSYYNTSYDQLDPEQKMALENHLSNQSNQAWRTSAQVASGVGRLAGGTGILLWAARH